MEGIEPELQERHESDFKLATARAPAVTWPAASGRFARLEIESESYRSLQRHAFAGAGEALVARRFKRLPVRISAAPSTVKTSSRSA